MAVPLRQLAPGHIRTSDGKFGEHTVLRQVNAESVLILGGGRALLMQIAHPQVAAGVAEHSKFREDRLGRLLRTLRPVYSISFGSTEQAETAARRVRGAHDRVVGAGYRAQDPALLLWVHATLIDTALVMYERLVEPLSEESRERYYQETTVMAELWGLPTEALPRTHADLEAYVAEQVATLEVSPVARELAREIFRLQPPHLAPALLVARELTSGLLPPRLRSQFDLDWGPTRAATLDVASRLSRALLPLLPRAWRRPPALLLPSPITEDRRRGESVS